MSLGRLVLSFKYIYDANLKMWGRKEHSNATAVPQCTLSGEFFFICEVDEWSRGKQKIKYRQLIKSRTGGMLNRVLMMQDMRRHIYGRLLCCMTFFGILFKGGCLMSFTAFNQRYWTLQQEVGGPCRSVSPLLISNLFYPNIFSSSYPFLTPFPQ